MINNVHLFFILASRFPTEKAYGVTTEFSAQAAKKLNFDVNIVTPKYDYTLSSSVRVIQKGEVLYRILLSNNLKKFNGLRFFLFNILFSLVLSYSFRNKINVFWTRDIFLSWLLSLRPSCKVVCEIHRSPQKTHRFVLFFLKRKKNVVFAPITSRLQNKLNIAGKRTVIAPMSINSYEQNFFSDNSVSKENQIVYVGNFQSYTHKLNVNLINELGYFLDHNYSTWKIEVVGIDSNTFKTECDKTTSGNITVTGRLDRVSMFKKLGRAKIGLVIYPNTDYFKDSFPIKIVEYAIAKVPIVASETDAHKSILGEGKCVYFNSGSQTSLNNAVASLINSDELSLEVSKKAFEWASDLTYDKRISTILKCLEL